MKSLLGFSRTSLKYTRQNIVFLYVCRSVPFLDTAQPLQL